MLKALEKDILFDICIISLYPGSIYRELTVYIIKLVYKRDRVNDLMTCGSISVFVVYKVFHVDALNLPRVLIVITLSWRITGNLDFIGKFKASTWKTL